MRTIASWIVSVILISISLCGCSHNGHSGKATSLWSPLDPQADSLVEYLELRTDSTIYDEADSVIALRVDSIGRAKGIEQLRARAAYFKLLVTNRKGIKLRHTPVLDSILAMTDSAAFPYDYHRFMLSYPPKYFSDEQQMRTLIEGARFMKLAGDSLFYAETCNKIAVTLIEIGDTVGAIRYMQTAVDYYNGIGAITQASVVWYNLAYITFDSGDVERAGSMVDSLLQIPEFTSHVSNVQTAELIKYYQTSNPRYLHHILSLADEKYAFKGMVPWAAIYLADHYREAGNRDSMLYYKNLFAATIPQIRFEAPKICETAAKVYDAVNLPDSAAMFRNDAADMYAARLIKSKAAATMRTENEGRIREAMDALAVSQQESASVSGWKIFAFCSLVLLIFGGISVMLTKFSRSRKHVKQNDEKKEALELLRNCGKLTPDMLPEFKQRLSAVHPDLSPAETRISCLIFLGLDTKDIATILSITPDSVKKGRQRLRNRLSLPPETDLTTYLNCL